MKELNNVQEYFNIYSVKHKVQGNIKENTYMSY